MIPYFLKSGSSLFLGSLRVKKMRWGISFIFILALGRWMASCGAPTPVLPKLSSPGPTTPSWKVIGSGLSPGLINFPSITSSGGILYLAYSDYPAGPSNQPTVLSYSGSSWVTVGLPDFTGNSAYYGSIALNSGTPYLAFEDGSTTPTQFEASLYMFNGSNWLALGGKGFSPGATAYESLAFSGTTPYVAFEDEANANKASLMSYNGSNWSAVGGGDFSTGTAYYLSLAMNGSTPYVAYQDMANGQKATVMTYNGVSWSALGGVAFTPGTAQYTSLALSGTTPYLAYSDSSQGGKTTVMSYNGGSWQNVGNAGFSAGPVTFISLAINGTTPYVAYQDAGNGNKATLMSYNGTSWQNVGGVAGFSSGPATFTSLAIYNGNPTVAFSDGSNSGKATVMSYQ